MNKRTLLTGGSILVLAIAAVIVVSNQNSSRLSGQSPSIQNKGETPPYSASSTAPAASYTLADVAQHATQFDCWMAIEGKVYNVTNYIGEHPGGKAILRGCGKDATILFDTRPDGPGTPHPPEARQILPQFYVGDLKM